MAKYNNNEVLYIYMKKFGDYMPMYIKLENCFPDYYLY